MPSTARRHRVIVGPEWNLFVRIALHLRRSGLDAENHRSETLAIRFGTGRHGYFAYVTAYRPSEHGIDEMYIGPEQPVKSVQQAADFLVIAGVLPAGFASWAPKPVESTTGTAAAHGPIDSDDFRAGVAYAAHILRHSVNLAHGHSGYIPPDIGIRPCCRAEVIAYAAGMSEGFDETAGPIADHTHDQSQRG